MRIPTILALYVAFAVNLRAADQPSLNPHLTFLLPLLGKTMKGAFTTSTPDKPIVDVQHWERALNGQAIRVLHSINHGVYGGETIFYWDAKKQAVVYYYFTTASYMTTGTITTNDAHIVTTEQVIGDSDGVTEVRSTSEIQPDGKFHVKAEYLKAGQWTFGHEVTYAEDAESRVEFK